MRLRGQILRVLIISSAIVAVIGLTETHLHDFIFIVFNNWASAALCFVLAGLYVLRGRYAETFTRANYARAFNWFIFGMAFLSIQVVMMPVTDQRALLRLLLWFLVLSEISYNLEVVRLKRKK